MTDKVKYDLDQIEKMVYEFLDAMPELVVSDSPEFRTDREFANKYESDMAYIKESFSNFLIQVIEEE